MTKQEITRLACEELEKIYPDIDCTLTYDEPYQLLIAARLAAQFPDERVNVITKKLFVKYPDLQAFADADLSELEQDVSSCNYYHTKAKNIKDMAQKLITDFGGEVPGTMEELLSLPGIGRKTANLVLGDIFGKAAIVTDTHCIRITGRLGMTKNTVPAKVEKDLAKLLDPRISSRFCHQTVQFGRDVCDAKKPKCGECTLSYFCKKYADDQKKG